MNQTGVCNKSDARVVKALIQTYDNNPTFLQLLKKDEPTDDEISEFLNTKFAGSKVLINNAKRACLASPEKCKLLAQPCLESYFVERLADYYESNCNRSEFDIFHDRQPQLIVQKACCALWMMKIVLKEPLLYENENSFVTFVNNKDMTSLDAFIEFCGFDGRLFAAKRDLKPCKLSCAYLYAILVHISFNRYSTDTILNYIDKEVLKWDLVKKPEPTLDEHVSF